MARKPTIAWEKIKHEYISTDVSYKDLAKKYGISLRSIAGKASDEDWTKQKENYCINLASKVHQKTVEKTSETLAEYAARQTADIVKINELLIGKVYETMAYGDAFSPRDLKSLSGLLSDLMMNRKSMMEEQNAGANEADRITVVFEKGDWDADT